MNPPNRFGEVHREAHFEHFEDDEEALHDVARAPTRFLPDAARSLVVENDSPDVPFRYSANPYRGCEHGCSYCYARPYHEFLGLNAGLDFESMIFVKEDAPRLLREFLARDAWKPEPITFSGVTDCYQPAERRYRLTRQCLEVCLEARQPVGIITKNALVLRDLDVLGEMAARRLVHVNVSLTTLDAELGRTMEPRTSSPAARLRTIRTLADSGVPVRVMAAPIIPGLNDSELPAILEAAKDAGAGGAGYVLLRLPLAVEPVFLEWLRRTQPLKAPRVEGLIRGTRGGKYNVSAWGERMRGAGAVAEQIATMFRLFARKHGLDGALPPLDVSAFEPPQPRSGQLRLF